MNNLSNVVLILVVVVCIFFIITLMKANRLMDKAETILDNISSDYSSLKQIPMTLEQVLTKLTT
jgi:uncharacterized protein YoxC